MRTPNFRALFRLALRRPDLRVSDIEDEIAFHLQERIDALVSRGWSDDDAAFEAKRRFGDPVTERPALLAAARQRDTRLDLFEWIDTVRTDLEIAARQLRRAPSFALGTITAFALGIGANATMFNVIDRLLVRPPAEIASPNDVYVIRVGSRDEVSFPAFVNLRDQLSGVASIAAQRNPWPLPIGRGDQSRMAQTVFVDGGYFRTLGVRPALGRLLSDNDARLPDGETVAVIGFGLWQRQFNGDSSVIGRELMVSSQRVYIVGVAPEDFNSVGTRPIDLWMPVTLARLLLPPGPTWPWATSAGNWLLAIARVAPHVSPEKVAKRATMLMRAGLAEHPAGDTSTTVELNSIVPSRTGTFSPEAKVASLLGAVSVLVLLIACSNATNLILARAVRRRREIGIRLALGVSRARLVAHLLTDSMLLSALGGIAAVGVAAMGSALMRGVLLDGFVWNGGLIDARTIAFIACAVVAAGLLTGLVPAFVLLRRFDLSRAIGEGRQSGGVHRQRVISSLVVTQTVLSTMLLIGALLFVRSLTNVRAVPLGVDTEHTVVVSLDSRTIQASGAGAGADALFAELRVAVARVPGVADVAVAEGMPFDKWYLSTRIGVPELSSDSPVIKRGAFIRAVTSDYFATIGTRIVQGRAFTNTEDRPNGERIAIVSAEMARAVWPRGDAVGQCIRVAADSIRLGADSVPCRRIVGIAEGTRESAVDPEDLESSYADVVYLPLSQGRHTVGARVVLARITVPPSDVVGRVRSVVQEVDPNMPLADVWVMQSRLDPELRPWRLGATMFSVFGGLALLLAALGLYSVIAYSVAQRSHEMGIRVALGARPSHILSLVGTQGAVLAGIGVAIAMIGAAVLAPLVQPLLFQTSARSFEIYALVACGMLVIGAAASLLPASRAARVDPMSVMRSD